MVCLRGVQVSATEEHVGLLKTIFDFSAIKALLAREDFSLLYDSMHGVQGPYAKVQIDVVDRVVLQCALLLRLLFFLLLLLLVVVVRPLVDVANRGTWESRFGVTYETPRPAGSAIRAVKGEKHGKD